MAERRLVDNRGFDMFKRLSIIVTLLRKNEPSVGGVRLPRPPLKLGGNFGSWIVFFSLHFRSIFYFIFAVNATLTILAFGSLLGHI